MTVTVRFVGCGDAFGTGGRHQTCLLVTHDEGRFLIDCGASALIAMREQAVEPDAVDFVLVSHLHGDHFGGLPFLLLDAQYASRRSRSLRITGPPGIEGRLRDLMEVTFPGSWATRWRFPLEIDEIVPGRPRAVEGIAVEAWEVSHPSGAPTLALRMELEGRVVAYSGDTEWVSALREVARGADLFVAECYRVERGVPYHLNHADLTEHADEIEAKRIILCHLGREALERQAELSFEVAEDGLEVRL